MCPDLAFAIRLIRQARGLSQYQLAVAGGFWRNDIQRYETGKASPDLPNLHRLAKALRVTARTLLLFAERVEAVRLTRRVSVGRMNDVYKKAHPHASA